MKELKPVGTEFWYDFPLNLSSTETRRTRIKYKVINHVLVKKQWMEELKAIDNQYIED